MVYFLARFLDRVLVSFAGRDPVATVRASLAVFVFEREDRRGPLEEASPVTEADDDACVSSSSSASAFRRRFEALREEAGVGMGRESSIASSLSNLTAR